MTADLFDDDFQDDKKSSDFAKMFEASLGGVEKKLNVGDKIQGEVLAVGREEIFVSTGTTDDGIVLKTELKKDQPDPKVGDVMTLFVTQIKDGQYYLSPSPTAKNLADDLEDAFDMMLPIEGKVTEVCNGGFRVSVMGKMAFCPISQIDLRRVDDSSLYIGKKFEFIVTQFSERGRNVVVSRRRLLEEQQESSQAAFLEDHKLGDLVQGVVTRMEKFGAFVELTSGVEGLVHISEISWSRLGDPHEALSLGQSVSAKILKMEAEGGRTKISLSIKQATQQPWEAMPAAIVEGATVEGKVTKCLNFGAFVEVAPGIEGLVPLSEMSHTKRVLRSDELFKEGDRITVLIKEIRGDERRLLLSFKDSGGDSWSNVGEKLKIGTIVRGRVERREPYGLFVKLDEGVVGLLPKSKAAESSDFSYDKYKVGDEVTVEVAEIREQDRRISLSVPLDPNAEVWRGYSSKVEPNANLGTLGDQFKTLFSAQNDTPKAGQKKK